MRDDPSSSVRHLHTACGLLRALNMAGWEFDQMTKKDLRLFYLRHVQPFCYYIPFHELVITLLKAKLIIRTNDLSIIKFDNHRVMVKLGEIQSGELRMSKIFAERQIMMQNMFNTHHIRLVPGIGVPPIILNDMNRTPIPRPSRNRNNNQNNNNQNQSPPKNVTQNGGFRHQPKPLETFVDQRFGFSLGKTLEPDVIKDIKNFCKECAKSFQEADDFAEHCLTKEHKFRAVYMKASKLHPISSKVPPKELTGEKYGILVESLEGKEGTANMELQVLLTVNQQLKSSRSSKEISLQVQNSSPSSSTITMSDTFLVFGSRDCTLLENDYPVDIESGEFVERRLTCFYDSIGTKEFIVVFKFSTEEDLDFFVMKRIHLRVDDELTAENGKAVSYKRRLHLDRFEQNGKEDAENWADFDYNIKEPVLEENFEPPPRPTQPLKYTVTLGLYPLPQQYINYFNYGFKSSAKASVAVLKKKLQILEYLSEGLNESNYCRYMALLLFLDEHQSLCDLRSYRMEGAQLERINYGRNFRLTVPGLAENRPSVLKQDGIYITLDNKVFKGYIAQVEETSVRIGMGSRFRDLYVDKMKVTVHFSFNRSCLRNMHRALELINDNKGLTSICYPKTFGSFTEDIKIPSWFNRMISMNPQQCQAVQNILCGTSKPSPYLIFGPPGTGKTVTIVESIKQIYQLLPNARVLATAPSNAAADLLADRIMESVPKSKIIRLYGPSRDYRTVPEKLRPVSNFFEGECIFPAKNKLMEYRVVVTTVIVSGRFVSSNFPVGHFDFIYVDECGHGLEASSLVPIAGLIRPAPRPTQVILAGDPKQLGPVVRSPVAKQLGLADSLLHRHMETIELYQKRDGEYNSRCVTKLLRNFRSHPQILKIPSELFYSNELIPCGDMTITSSACNWEWLPTPDFPLIFHGIEGKDERERSSPSFFNMTEVAEVVNYVEKISTSKFSGQRLRPSDVGIVSPYRGQVNKIHRALERKGLTGYSVGSVEEFQGQERRVIIISTVRSNPGQLALDHKFRLGFVREPRRFNVAITRAKALLIIIGNPYILQTDHNWRQMIELIIKGGGYTGVPFNLTPTDEIVGEDPNEHRIPVQEKLLEQLKLTKQAIEHFETDGAVPIITNGEDKADQTERLIKQLQEMNILKAEVSEVEEMISPPFQQAE